MSVTRWIVCLAVIAAALAPAGAAMAPAAPSADSIIVLCPQPGVVALVQCLANLAVDAAKEVACLVEPDLPVC